MNLTSKVLKLYFWKQISLRIPLFADSEPILLAIMKVKNNSAFHLLESSNVTYDKIIEQLTLQPDIHAGLGVQ